MKTKTVCSIATILIAGMVLLFHSCKKKDNPPVIAEIQYAEVAFPRLTLKHERYYLMDHDARSLEMEFSEIIDSATVQGNVSFSDNSGSLDTQFSLAVSGRKLVILFHPDFGLHHGWKYRLTIGAGLRSTSGNSLGQKDPVEIRTTSGLELPNKFNSLPQQPELHSKTSSQRISIACISDIHMGDTRAVNGNYCWFSKNKQALESFLDFIANSTQVKQLVILGDLFDEWVVPYSVSPLDPQAGISNSKEYFEAIANSPTNSTIIEKLKVIASSGIIELVYIPGNHDMLLTQDILQEIIPGITWRGDVSGIGRYDPVNGIIMEHGHRYDFFNCPQPLVNPGHMLPPGYFISRLYAQGMYSRKTPLKNTGKEPGGSTEFLSAWNLAYLYTLIHFSMTPPPPDSAVVLMGGIDGYSNPLSFNGARDIYTNTIEGAWPQTQTTNAVPVQMDCVNAILNGTVLLNAALIEFMDPSTAPNLYKMVVFGHSHDPSTLVYPSGKAYTSIYANTGSWVNAEESSHPVRTFLIISPAAWTGSDIDVVSLYQYNLDSNNGGQVPVYTPVLISEESIEND